MEEKKHKKNLFLTSLLILFLIYFSLFLMDKFGYYNVSSRKTILTEEKLHEFELDVKNGVEIDLIDYIEDDVYYENFYSDIGYNLSKTIDKIFNGGIMKVGKYVKKLFQ